MVDNSEMNIYALKLLIRTVSPNITVKEAINGEDRLAVYKELLESKFRRCGVMKDLGRPTMNGIDCSKEIRKYEKVSGLKPIFVTALTAFTEDHLQTTCMNAGMDAFYKKPVSIKDLSALLSKLVQYSKRLVNIVVNSITLTISVMYSHFIYGWRSLLYITQIVKSRPEYYRVTYAR
jgi:CheY-like chemotaxis protein